MTTFEEEKSNKGGMDRRVLKGLGIGLLFCVLALWKVLFALLWQVALGVLVMAASLPLCRILERRFPRSLASTLSLSALTGVLAIFILLFVPLLWRQSSQLVAMAPGILQGLQDMLSKFQSWLEQQGIPFAGDTQQVMLAKMQEVAGTALPALMAWVGGWADGLSKVFLAPVFAFYFLRDREELGQRLSLWVPLKHRRKAVAVVREIRREMSGYWRGQLMISGVTGVLTAVGLLIVGVPAWLLLGLLMGILEFVPYIGPFIGAVPVFLFSLPMGWGKVFWAMAVVLLVQQMEGGMISPHLMSGATRLHPVTVLLTISAGGLLGGVVGMLISVPALVSFRGALRILRKESFEP